MCVFVCAARPTGPEEEIKYLMYRHEASVVSCDCDVLDKQSDAVSVLLVRIPDGPNSDTFLIISTRVGHLKCAPLQFMMTAYYVC